MNVIRNFVIYSEGIWLVYTIFIFMQNKGQNETRVKLIIITYLNKIVVSHTSTMIMVYMNVLQFYVCSNCYILVYWLPTYWEIYEMQYFYVTIQSTPFQLHIQWFSTELYHIKIRHFPKGNITNDWTLSSKMRA